MNGADIVQHFGCDRSQQEPPHRAVVARGEHHQIGAVLLRESVDHAARLSQFRDGVEFPPWEVVESELPYALLFEGLCLDL